MASAEATVAILTRNGEATLERLLIALRDQQTDRRIECVAIDSASTDRTRELLADHGARVIEQATSPFDFGTARDELFALTTTPFILSLSQDAIPSHNLWAENLLAPLREENVAAASGSSSPDAERGIRQFTWEKNGYFYFTRQMGKFRKRYGKGISFSNCAVRRSAWEKIGGIGPQPLGEDFLFQTKALALGMEMAFPQDAAVLHHHDYALGGLFSRRKNEGLALRLLGFSYTEWDFVRDVVSPRKYVQWLREWRRGDIRSPAECFFPMLSPVAVYMGSHFGTQFEDYRTLTGELDESV